MFRQMFARKNLETLLAIPPSDRLKQRYAKFRNFGHFLDKSAEAIPEKVEAPAAV